MFGRASRRSPAPPESGSPSELGYHTETILVADPDVPAMGRVRALFVDRALGLQGHSGEARGYDRGDPANSFSAVVETQANPIDARARVGIRDQIVLSPVPEYTDTPSFDTSVPESSYMASLWQRVGRL